MILDRDLAAIYGVTTAAPQRGGQAQRRALPRGFNVRPHRDRAPSRSGSRKLRWAFTERGAIQAANVLNSRRALETGIYVVRAFVQLRELLASNKELARCLDELEARMSVPLQKSCRIASRRLLLYIGGES